MERPPACWVAGTQMGHWLTEGAQGVQGFWEDYMLWVPGEKINKTGTRLQPNLTHIKHT